MYEIFEMLCKQKGVTPYRVCKDTGLTTASISNWKAGRYVPKQDKMQTIADYFGVSIKYIMTGKEDSELSTQQPQGDDIKVEFDRFREMLEHGEIKPLCYDNTPAGPKEIKALLKMLDASEEMIRNMLNSEE